MGVSGILGGCVCGGSVGESVNRPWGWAALLGEAEGGLVEGAGGLGFQALA